MYSKIDPSFLYTDISSDITENDLDVVSDLWTIENRDVYRGSRDPRYTHANVYWLYDEDLQRVGCSEHDKKDHARFHILWFHESEFATLLQEEGWSIGEDIWSHLPRHVFERFLNEGWTTPLSFLEQSLKSDARIVTPSMLLNMPVVYSCSECKKVSLKPICSSNQVRPLDFPDISSILFIDDDLVLHSPPPNSRVFMLLKQRHDDGSLQPQVLVQAPEEQWVSPQPQSPAQSPQPAPDRNSPQ